PSAGLKNLADLNGRVTGQLLDVAPAVAQRLVALLRLGIAPLSVERPEILRVRAAAVQFDDGPIFAIVHIAIPSATAESGRLSLAPWQAMRTLDPADVRSLSQGVTAILHVGQRRDQGPPPAHPSSTR